MLKKGHLRFHPGEAMVWLLLSALPVFSMAGEPPISDRVTGPISRPLWADYRLREDGAVDLWVCFNWSCGRRADLTFTPEDMASVTRVMAACGADGSLHGRIQRLRVGIWRMQLLAQRHLPELGNDRELNEWDRDLDGRLDCVDSATNTTSYLRVLQTLGQLPGWSVGTPEVRNLLDLRGVHWTAVAIDRTSGEAWSVDPWFRPHGHLPLVMPLQDWLRERKGWEPPFDAHNPYPGSLSGLCPKPAGIATLVTPPLANGGRGGIAVDPVDTAPGEVSP